MKTLGIAFVLSMFCVLSVAAQDKLPRFEDYAVSLYQGKLHVPKWIRHVGSSEWRDEAGKLVEPPDVNFAGKYYVGRHSCGTGCRYYTLTDLSSGRELDSLYLFATVEPPPKTTDGHEYLTVLYYRADSKVIVAQYLIDPLQRPEQCRERRFIFERGKVKPITKTRRSCTTF